MLRMLSTISALLACQLGVGQETAVKLPGLDQHPVKDIDLMAGHRGDPSSWPMYGGSYGQIRFSDLEQINKGNIKDLRPAWVFHTGVYNVASGYQTTPTVFDGAMYVTTPRIGREQWVIKIDARTGKEIWRKGLRQGSTRYCCGPNNRGVTLYEDKVIVATLDARVIALEATTGNVVWEAATEDGAKGL